MAPLLGPEWGTPVLPSLANADVNFFVSERRAVPASGGACTLAAIVKSQSLVDAVGSSLIPIVASPVGDVLTQTWAMLTIVVSPDREVTARAFKGTDFNSLCTAARTDLVVDSGPPGSPLDYALVREATFRVASPLPRPQLTAHDQVKLHAWAMTWLSGNAARLMSPVLEGGGGVPRSRLRLDGGPA